MRQRDACWAGEVSLTGSHIATLENSSPVSRYLYIDLWTLRQTQLKNDDVTPTQKLHGKGS